MLLKILEDFNLTMCSILLLFITINLIIIIIITCGCGSLQNGVCSFVPSQFKVQKLTDCITCAFCSLKKAAGLINGLGSDKFVKVLSRVIQKLHLKVHILIVLSWYHVITFRLSLSSMKMNSRNFKEV